MNTQMSDLWDEAKKEISLLLDEAQFTTWVERLQFVDFDAAANKIVLSAPSNFVRNICMQWKDSIESGLERIMGTPVSLEIEVIQISEPLAPSHTQNVTAPRVEAADIQTHSSNENQQKISSVVSYESHIKTRPTNMMSFESFVVNDSNEYAATTAKVIAERPGLQYNPFFIWGGPGLGKTHLLHAIENYVRQTFPTKKVHYVTAENFLNDFTTALSRKTNEQFRLKYRQLDVLLIDDVEFLSGKKETQMELFNTFNKMFEANKQMVFSCDQPIEKVRDIEERLVSRFSVGLTVSLKPPDFELRMAILQKWAEVNMLKMNFDAYEYVAANVVGSVRQLMGAFHTLLMQASIGHHPTVTKALAVEWLKDKVSSIVNTSPVSVDKIISVTAKYYNLKAADLTGESRVKDIAYARQIAMYLARTLTTLSTTQIGSHFGNKQHGTVISNVNKIQTLLDRPDEQTRYDVDLLTKKVTES